MLVHVIVETLYTGSGMGMVTLLGPQVGCRPSGMAMADQVQAIDSSASTSMTYEMDLEDCCMLILERLMRAYGVVPVLWSLAQRYRDGTSEVAPLFWDLWHRCPLGLRAVAHSADRQLGTYSMLQKRVILKQ